jgi:hypothetical protein
MSSRKDLPITKFREAVRSALEAYAKSYTGEIESATFQMILEDSARELNSCMDGIRQRFVVHQKNFIPEEKPKVTKLKQAMKCLGLEFKLTKNPETLMNMASSKKKALARAYHPDAHGGSEEMRELYEARLSGAQCNG